MVAGVVLAVILLALLPPVEANAAATLPSGFKESTVFSGLTNPTTVQFAKDGKVFVAEKGGLIKVFDDLSDTTPTTFADLRTNVYNFWDRGLLGLALDPNFPTNPYVYVLYTYDAEIGGTAPKWGTPGTTSDPCPNPPGATGDGCVVSGRLSRLQADVNTNTMSGSEQVLIEDWCQQYPSHSIGSLAFGRDGALYVSGGEGASFNFVDYGQDGNPLNPCGDPPGGVGGTQTPPTAEGGALRSQDLRTTSDPVGLDGTILRVDPATGAALSDNPLYGNTDPNARRIIADGFRNPFRIAIQPGTDEIWVGDVGWSGWEEINRIGSPTGSAVGNFGWPCYEGSGRQSGYDDANLNICENLYGTANAVTKPYYAYQHSATVVAGETCPTGSSSIAGLAFYGTGPYPDEYDGALFFADYSRNCIWAMRKGADGALDPSTLTTFVAGAAGPVDLQIGPGGDLFYADFSGGTIRRIEYSSAPPPEEDKVLGAVSDTRILENSPDQGYGGSTPIGADGDDPNGTGKDKSALIKWDTSGIAPGTKVNSASVTLSVTNPSPQTYEAYALKRAWTETAATWKNYDSAKPWEVAGAKGSLDREAAVAGTITASATGKQTFTLDPAVVQGWVDNPASNQGIIIADAANTDGLDFSSREATDSTQRPQLTVSLGAADATPPTVSSVAPADGATNVAPTDNVEATFSEDMDASTLTTSTFTLTKQGSSTAVAAAVSYDSATDKATLNPDANLEGNTTYTATVKGGSSGVKDAAGNPLGADKVWSFTTQAKPNATISSPSSTLKWRVNDVIDFSGSATDSQGNALPASALSWSVILHHCSSDNTSCHEHPVQSFEDVASGSFTAPDHEYPSHLELRLTATDSSGSDTESVRLDPETVALTFQTNPTGLNLTVGSSSARTPFSRTVIIGSKNTVSAPSPQKLKGKTYTFVSWSDGGARSHDIIAPAAATTYTATYQQQQR